MKSGLGESMKKGPSDRLVRVSFMLTWRERSLLRASIWPIKGWNIGQEERRAIEKLDVALDRSFDRINSRVSTEYRQARRGKRKIGRRRA